MQAERLRVLLIEPDVIERDRLVSQLDAEVDLTATSRLGDSLAQLAQRAYDIALVSGMLAEGSAAEAVMRLHRVTPGLPILVLSEDVQDAPAKAALRAGAQDAVPRRRAGADVLLHAMRSALARRRAEESTERFLREVGARTQAEAAERRSRVLADAARISGGSLDLDEMLLALAQWMVPQLADACVIEMAPGSATGTRPPVIHGQDAAGTERVQKALRRGTDANDFVSILDAIPDGRAAIVDLEPSLLKGATSPEQVRIIGDLDLAPSIVVPLSARDRTLGAIAFLAFRGGRQFSREDFEISVAVSRQIALGVDNARLYDEARQAVRAREEVLAIVSHDLRNPLNVMFTGVSLMRKAIEDRDPRLARQLDRMNRAAERMNHLIRDLLDVARIEGGRLTVEIARHDAATIAVEIADLLRPLGQEKGIRIVARTEEALPIVACDRDRALQVLGNLVGNALKFTPRGGQITVIAERDEIGVRLAVQDTGPGIARVDQPRIFDRFWQGDREAREGAGLGLAISKGIVEAHGGRIGVESEPGAGATFWFTLPSAAEKPA